MKSIEPTLYPPPAHTHILPHPHTQLVIDSLQTVLDMAETSVLLEAVVKNIIIVAKHSPQHLGRHFQVWHVTWHACTYMDVISLSYFRWHNVTYAYMYVEYALQLNCHNFSSIILSAINVWFLWELDGLLKSRFIFRINYLMTRSPIHIRYPLPPPTPPACTHVQNTVDILVGWHIDIQQDPQLIESISAALVCFREFWTKDMLFSTDLLKQFLEDMEAYCSVSVCGVVWCVCVWPVGVVVIETLKPVCTARLYWSWELLIVLLIVCVYK